MSIFFPFFPCRFWYHRGKRQVNTKKPITPTAPPMQMPTMAPVLSLEPEDDVDSSVVVLEEPEERTLLPNSKTAAGGATSS